jgi:hypothetical protein
MTSVAAATANPFMGWGPQEAARRQLAGDPAPFSSWGPAAAASRVKAGIPPQARFAALVARRADAIGAAPDGIEMRSYGDMAPIPFAVRGRGAEALVTASSVMARQATAEAEETVAVRHR